MERTTCYKLCYALGVSAEDLSRSFSIEHRVACSFGVFNPGPVVRKFRALSALYYHVMKRYYFYADIKSFRAGVSKFYEQFSVTCDYNPVRERGSRPLLEYMQEVGQLHNILARAAYRDLQIALPEDVFLDMTAFPVLTQQSAAQVAFIMSKTNHAYGLYFFGNDLLNVALGAMLQDDIALRDRLSLCFGARMPSVYDTSTFSVEVNKYLSAVFVQERKLSAMGRIKVLDEEKHALVVYSFLSRCEKAGVTADTLSDLSCLSEDDVFITAQASLACEMAPSFPATKFALLLPIESRYYKQCRRRQHPNVYLVSQW